ncbi:MAG: heme-copper oxidase subunit III [Flavobacteriaceae bacterium]|nr:heme-copper oxidase subunit III [Flavobacteriaceae bacterium]
MDLTQGTNQEKNKRAKKMMLWFGIISLIMSFAGLTSAFLVSRSREDWLTDFQLPHAFTISLVLIIVSSITIILAKRSIKTNKRPAATIFLLLTLVLGVAFIVSQINGFNEIIASGYNFTGPTSNVTMSYIYVIAFVHIVHVVAGLIAILVVVINHFRKKYSAENMLGVELAATFWHFIDILWIYLFLFLYFVR